MVQAFLVLLLAQVAGEAIAGQAGLPLPGVVLGLTLLLAALALRARLGAREVVPPWLAGTAQGLHAHLGLLFVPAGADIVAHLDLLATEGGAVLAAVIGSTLLGIAVAARIAGAVPALAEARR